MLKIEGIVSKRYYVAVGNQRRQRTNKIYSLWSVWYYCTFFARVAGPRIHADRVSRLEGDTGLAIFPSTFENRN